MKPRFLIGLLVFALVATTACNFSVNLGNNRVRGSGKVVSEERQVSGFDKVELNGSGELYIEQGDTEALTVEADDNLMEYITTEVRGDTLELNLKPNFNIMFSSKIVYRLTVKDLHGVSIAGSGKVVSSSLATDEFRISTAGSGKFEFDDLQADSLTASTGGSGEFLLKGKVDDVKVTISGSGKFNCPDLETASTDINITGSGEVTSWATEQLNIRISGSGSVRYYGSPEVNQSIAGSGSVRKLGDK
jgi:hypothetical protein